MSDTNMGELSARETPEEKQIADLESKLRVALDIINKTGIALQDSKQSHDNLLAKMAVKDDALRQSNFALICNCKFGNTCNICNAYQANKEALSQTPDAVKEMVEDKKRLEWLETKKNLVSGNCDKCSQDFWTLYIFAGSDYYKGGKTLDLRTAITAAMQKENK